MSETRKLTTIFAADVAGYSRLAASDEEGTLARLRTLRSNLIDPTIAVHHGRVVKRTGDGILVEFRSPVEAIRCALAVQNGMVERNGDLPTDRHIQFRVGIHLGDVVEEADGDLMGDAVNIAARLEGIAEPGSIVLSRTAHDQIEGKVGDRFVDLGDKELKNIPRPVRVYALARKIDRPMAEQAQPSAAPRLSIVVLPFANIGGDPEQEYFVDGVTESLTTDLSRISGSFVIGRNTAFTYKGKPADLKQIGRDLNVRYVLEGSVQKGSNRLRVNVQLIDAETGNHLWAERFDKPIADLFDMQDEIVGRLANQLQAQLVAVEARRAAGVANPDVVDLCFQGAAWRNKGGNPEDLGRAHHFYERALALEPDNVEAMIGRASVDTYLGPGLFSADHAVRAASAEAMLKRALARHPNHAIGHNCLGVLQIFTDRGTQAIAECERAIALDRNLAGAHAFIGLAKFTVGRAEETEAHIREALRLSPRDINTYLWLFYAGIAKLWIGADDEAVVWLQQAIGANSNFSIAHFDLAAALALLGRRDEARIAIKGGLALDPGLTLQRLRAGEFSTNPTYLAQVKRVREGLRLAGMPEGEPEKPSAPRLSIVVLPFANIGGDPEQEYFVDGLTEDLTTELSRIPGSFVIARNTAFTYKGKPLDVKQIGRDLNVRYVLEGSIRRGGNRVRVNAQLIDAESGAHLWADRFDRDLVNLFELQDAITAELANVLGVQLIEAESRKSQRVDNPDVLDLLMQARAAANRGISREHYDVAARLYERALERDPDNVSALGGLALIHANIGASLLTEDQGSEFTLASTLAQRALQLAPEDLVANYALAIALRFTGRFEETRRHLETVIRVNPNSRTGHNQFGWLLQSLGDYEGSMPYFEKALRLSPRDPYRFLELLGLGIAYSARGDLERALELWRQSYDVFPYTWTQLSLISGYAGSGRMDEARRHLETYLSGKPIVNTIAMARKNQTPSQTDRLRQMEVLYEGLRLAGMPEE